MKKEFDYFHEEGQWLPFVDVTLNYQKRQITTKALVDSGASFSVFQQEIAQYLGIPMEKGKKIYLTGIGGRILGYLHRVLLRIGEAEFSCKIVFSPELTVSLNLLGRDNFFQPFVISFFEANKKLLVKTNEKKS